MSFNRVLEAYDLLDDPSVTGERVCDLWRRHGVDEVSSVTIEGDKGSTDFVRGVIRGAQGKSSGGDAPTLGIVGRLGGLGARPERIGFVSDGDGALAAVAAAGKLGDMRRRGDVLPGDVIVATHICPDAPTRPHEPVAFMDSPVGIYDMNAHEVSDEMDAILSIDTTKGNRIVNHLGFAITPTIKRGWILRISEDLLQIYADSAGILPVTLPITMQDITPYGNDVYHLNSLVQPAVATDAPVVGVAITSQTPVPGCGTGATHLPVVDTTVRFCIEVAKAYGAGTCSFYDHTEYERLVELYGDMARLQSGGA
ncbi:MAG TPA: DUF1177 domain-containing protein [Propionibacteriaceae bacterium]|nr:DUF1177 domain-containing protein [Propionibacteriaceae bacterium]